MSAFSWLRPSAVPVVPGPDGPRQGPVIEARCDACLVRSTETHVEYVGAETWARLCDDAAGCARRYRGALSPATYAAGLRGELLAVAL